MALHVEMKSFAASSVLKHQHVIILVSDKERRSLHLSEGELEIVMQVVEVEEEVSHLPSQKKNGWFIASILG